MIQLDKVSKKLGIFELKDISFSLPAGYICGIAGRNGAGKTTLLHLLSGLYQPDSGAVMIFDSRYDTQEKQIHDSLGVVLNEDLMMKHLNLEKNGDYFGTYYSGYQKEQLLSYLKQFGLEKNRKFGKLSKGEKLKYQFAFALSCNPKLLILDEPTANFEVDFRKDFLKLLQEFIADGQKSVVLATHLMEDIDRLADYLIYMEDGRSIFAGQMEDFREQYRIVSGEAYKIKLLDREDIIAMEQKKYGAKALVRHHGYQHYDAELTATAPTVEEFMYFLSKTKTAERRNHEKVIH